MARDAWRGLRRAWDAMLLVAETESGDELEMGLRSVELRTLKSPNPAVAMALPTYRKYARRSEDALARLDLLVVTAAAAAFREREGRWPGSIAELRGGGLLTTAEADRLGEARLDGAQPGRPLEVKLDVYSGEEKRPTEELALKVRPPARAR